MAFQYETTEWGYQVTVGGAWLVPFKPAKDFINKYYSLSYSGILTIRESYGWNGSNCSLDTRYSMEASAVHDALCQMLNKGEIKNTYENRAKADALYIEMCKEAGGNPVGLAMRASGLFLHRVAKYGLRLPV